MDGPLVLGGVPQELGDGLQMLVGVLLGLGGALQELVGASGKVQAPDIVSPTPDRISSACILSVESSRVDQLASPGIINHQPFSLSVLQSICIVNSSLSDFA